MKKSHIVFFIILVLALALTTAVYAEEGDPDPACWGQATAVFAQTGEMGEHASQQATPRYGLRNLARELFDAGVIEDDSMQALGAFVAAELGLEVDACNLED